VSLVADRLQRRPARAGPRRCDARKSVAVSLEHALGDLAARGEEREPTVRIGDEIVTAEGAVSLRERRELHVGSATDDAAPLLRQLPAVFVVHQQPALDELATVRVRRERKGSELVRHEVVGRARRRLLAVEEQQLLEVELACRAAERVEQLQHLPLAREQHGGRLRRCAGVGGGHFFFLVELRR